MDSSIAFDVHEHSTHVELTCAGTYSEDAARAVFEQAFELAGRSSRTAVLVDARMVTGRQPTMMQRYNHAIHVTELQRRQLPLIALAILGHEPMVHPERFGEIVARNRGAIARVFTDEVRARAWLLQESKSP